MRRSIASVAGLPFSAFRHAGWWLEWQTRMAPQSGSRDLADMELSAES
jgi:hypothetical protein